MKYRSSRRAVCPFYRHETSQVITCDGVQPESVIHVAFASKAAATLYKESRCKSWYSRCEVCRMLDQIQEENEFHD